jgi:hypothetical protein
MGRGQEGATTLLPVALREEQRRGLFVVLEELRQTAKEDERQEAEHLISLISSLNWDSPGEELLSRYRLMKIAESLSGSQEEKAEILESITSELPRQESDVFRLFLGKEWQPGEAEDLWEKYLEKEGVIFDKMGPPFDLGSVRLSSGETIAFLNGRAIPRQKGYGSGKAQDISAVEMLQAASRLRSARGQLQDLLLRLEEESTWSEVTGLQSKDLRKRLKRLLESDAIASLEEMVLSSGADPLRATEARLTYVNLLSEMHLLLEEQFDSVLEKSAADHFIETKQNATQGTIFATIDDNPEKKASLESLTEEKVAAGKREIRNLRDSLLQDLSLLSGPLASKGRRLAKEDGVSLQTDGGNLQYLLFREALGEIERGQHANSDQLLDYLNIHLGGSEQDLWGKNLVGQDREQESALPNLSSWIEASVTGNTEEASMKRLQKITRLIYGAKLAESDPKLKPLTDDLFAREAKIREKASVAGKIPDSPLFCLPNEVWSSTKEDRFFSAQVAPQVYEEEVIEGGVVSGHHFWDEGSFRSVVYTQSLHSQFTSNPEITEEEWGEKTEMIAVHELIHSGQPLSPSETMTIEQALGRENQKASTTMIRESLNEGLTQLLTYTRISPTMAAAPIKENLPISTSFDSKYIDEVSAWLQVFEILGIAEGERASLLDTLNSMSMDDVIDKMNQEIKKREDNTKLRGKNFIELWESLLSPDAVTRKRNK